MAEFVHGPIDLEGRSIRLLKLSRGIGFPLQGELFDARLEEEGVPYEALSYTWGSSEKTSNIIIDGKFMYITESLSEALRKLRRQESDRILWIDAVCIDQNNHQEQGHQVRQMGDIYKNAENVIVWLGLSTGDIDVAMDLIDQLHSLDVRRGHSEESWTRYSQSVSAELKDQMNSGVLTLLKRPWFRRVWILQEVANARVATIVCGDKTVSARTFALVPSFLGITPENHVQAVLEVMPGVLRRRSWFAQKPTLHTLLLKFHKSEATKPHDKIFALFGMSSDACGSHLIHPDYSKSVAQVIRDTVLLILTSNGDRSTNSDPALTPSTTETWDLNFLNWSMENFLQNLKSLRAATIKFACQQKSGVAGKALAGASRFDLEDASILSWAIRNDYNDLAKNVIEWKPVNIDVKDTVGRTPLVHSTQDFSENFVTLLEKKNIDIDLKDEEGRTALSYAAQRGSEDIVKLLMATQQVIIDSRDLQDRTPLSYASQGGHLHVVELLLTAGAVDVDTRDERGKTPFLYAAQRSHRHVVNRLLATKRVDINARTENGRTPLSFAAEAGAAQVVNLLLAADHIEVDTKDEHGKTPLWYSFNASHSHIMELLLETGKVDIHVRNKSEGTLFSYASSRGNERILKLLLATNKVDTEIDFKDGTGRTPLSYASEYGQEGTMKLLLASDEVDVNSKSLHFQETPLLYAIRTRRTGAVRLLLASDQIDVNCQNRDGLTPLILAVKTSIEIMKLLLASDKIEVNAKDVDGRTAFWLACVNFQPTVVQLFLATNKVDIDAGDADGRTPFSQACGNGSAVLVEFLLATGKVDVNSKCRSRQMSPLKYAIEGDHSRVIKLLLATSKIDLNDGIEDGTTPLSYAVEMHNSEAVKLLLDTKKVNINVPDRKKLTSPLHHAVFTGQEKIVRLLLATEGVYLDEIASLFVLAGPNSSTI